MAIPLVILKCEHCGTEYNPCKGTDYDQHATEHHVWECRDKLTKEVKLLRETAMEVERQGKEIRMLRREIRSIEEVFADRNCPLSMAGEIEHHITCHADTLAGTARILADALVRIAQAGEERHDREDPG